MHRQNQDISLQPILLTIAIPTYNRCCYLKELLAEITYQMDSISTRNIEILVIDNASTDDTPKILAGLDKYYLRCIRNNMNIGGDKNFLECIKNGVGEYIWLFGDDEIMSPNAIAKTLTLLSTSPGLLVTESGFNKTQRFNTYKDLLVDLQDIDPIFFIQQTLITRNVFPRKKFDMQLAIKNISTNFSHIYGLLPHLKNAKNIIVLSHQESAFKVRDVRADFSEAPRNLEIKLVNLSKYAAIQLEYPKLGLEVFLYYNIRSIFRLRRSRKFKRLLRILGF